MEPEENLPFPAPAVVRVHDDQPVVPLVVNPPPPAQLQRGARARGHKFSSAENIYLMEAMLQVLPIGPDEWDEVWNLHSVQFPGRDCNGLRRKYTTLHRKKMPTGDPFMPDEVRMAKHCKVCIAQKAELGDGTGQYDMLQDDDRADDDPEEGIPIEDPCLDVLPLPNPPSTNSSTRSGLSPRKSKVQENQDFFALMAMQMQNEAAQRAHEACE